MRSSTIVRRAEIRSEPRQPSRLEKNKNITALQLQPSILDQCADQREQSLVLGAAAACTKELPDLDQGRSPPRADVRQMLDDWTAGARIAD